jgi:hypothetical protein
MIALVFTAELVGFGCIANEFASERNRATANADTNASISRSPACLRLWSGRSRRRARPVPASR